MKQTFAVFLLLCAGCVESGRVGPTRLTDAAPDFEPQADDLGYTPSTDLAGAPVQRGCDGLTGCYTVYAHSDRVLYLVNLANKTLQTVGAFNAPMVFDGHNMVEDVITDLAVAPDYTIYVISRTNLYTADPNDGHVTLVGATTACGAFAVALTAAADGNLYTADYQGAFCRIDLSAQPIKVNVVGTLLDGLALSGDLVGVADGTIYGSAYRLSDAANKGTQLDNLLVKIDPATGKATEVRGATGYGKLFGVAYALGNVFGFTHDGSGKVVTIDPKTGKGTLFNTFVDPATNKGIAFAGAGVNALVPPIR